MTVRAHPPADWEFWDDNREEHPLEDYWEGLRVAPLMVVQQIARNLHCPAEVLAQMAESDDFYVGTAVVDHPNATPEIIGRIARHHPSPLVRKQAIRDLRCPRHVRAMAKLAE